MISFLLLAATALTPAHAESLRDYAGKELKTYIECGLTTGAVDCEELTRGFFTTYGAYFERVNRRDDASVRLKLTDQSVSGQPTEFTFAWSSDEVLGVSDFAYVVKLDPSATDSITRINTLIASIGKGASLYLKVITGEVDDSGQLVITSGTPVATKPASKFSQSPYYVNLYGSGYGSKNGGNRSWSGYAGASMNYSTDKVRLIAGTDYSTTSTTVPTDAGSISAKNTGFDAYGVAAFSFRKRWSAALVGKTARNPGQNIKADNEIAAGLEWDLVPYRTTETREVYVRVGGGLEDLKLFSENDLGYANHQYAMIFAQMYANWMFADSKAKFSLSGNVTTFPKFKGYEKYGTSSSLYYQITPAIQVNGSYSLNYQKKSLTFPKNPDYTNPLQSMYLSGAPGVSSSFSFGINVTLGNSLRKSRDRRWNF
ncbi:MAG: hypothetical protein JST04_07115 [Bdellovibrionales bacterium]|nr:hypothetical protein [Bdellovibrionales bacterium]